MLACIEDPLGKTRKHKEPIKQLPVDLVKALEDIGRSPSVVDALKPKEFMLEGGGPPSVFRAVKICPCKHFWTCPGTDPFIEMLVPNCRPPPVDHRSDQKDPVP